MIEMEKPNIECVEMSDDGRYGKFVVSPLERGYGTTLGNSLRRILLSSLPGAAATSIKIEGVQHEFSTVPGVTEDVTELILNIKKLALKIHGDLPKTVYIEAKGAQEITAGDIKRDDDVEIFNPDLHIATLNDDANLYIEITLSKGRGYVSADKNKQAMQPVIGVIPVDSIYTPVTKVNYTVENTRVGQYTDREQLAVELWTNGTIKPDEAVSLAAKIMNDLLSLFVDLDFIKKQMSVQTIGHDKLNQLRHARFFGDFNGMLEHMKKHADIIRPKFEAVLEMLDKELGDLGIAKWTKPNGGYFIGFDTMDGCAKKVVAMCKEAGVVMTPAGATYPYGKDPHDSNIRIAPTFPSTEELKQACEIFVTCVKLVSLDKILETK